MNMHKTKDNIRLKIVFPLIIMLLISGVILALGSYNIEQEHLNHGIENKTLEVDRLFGKLLGKESKFMTAQLQFIANDPGLIKAWQSRNRADLYDRASSIFRKMNSDFNVSHFYFIEPDKTCFLRVHAPENYGDEITRYTMQDAVVKAKTSSGVELGPLGTFTLRVVYPWINNGKIIGYLELGQEIESIGSRLKKASGLDLIFMIDKLNLDKETYERRMQALNKASHWDDFTETVIVDKSITTLPVKLQNIVQQNNLHKKFRKISIDNRLFSIFSQPLEDASGRGVGSTVVIYDITDEVMKARKTVWLMVMSILVIFLLILLFYYRYSGKLEKRIYSYRHNLEDLVKERTRELHIALDEVKVLSGFLPICASCKQIRDDKGYWTQIESYISDHSEAEFSHGICPDCANKLYPGVSYLKSSDSRKDQLKKG